jgi:hypothetical protein
MERYSHTRFAINVAENTSLEKIQKLIKIPNAIHHITIANYENNEANYRLLTDLFASHTLTRFCLNELESDKVFDILITAIPKDRLKVDALSLNSLRGQGLKRREHISYARLPTAISAFSHIDKLCLRNMCFQDTEFETLCTALGGAHTITELDLSENPLCVTRMLALSQTLKDNPSILSLDLFMCCITDIVFQVLALSLTKKSALKLLFLRSNKITFMSVIPPSLEELSLANNPLGAYAFIYIYNAIAANTSLKRLCFGSVANAEIEIYEPLRPVFSTNNTLVYCSITSVRFSSEALNSLCRDLHHNTSLTEMRVNGRWHMEFSVHRFAELMRANSTLRVFLPDCRFGTNFITYDSGAIVHNPSITDMPSLQTTLCFFGGKRHLERNKHNFYYKSLSLATISHDRFLKGLPPILSLDLESLYPSNLSSSPSLSRPLFVHK